MGSRATKCCTDPPLDEGSSGAPPAAAPPNGVPIYLNVYNLQRTPPGGTTLNGAMGFGFYHSGIEVFHCEYAFGGGPNCDAAQPGIFCTYPRSALPPEQFHTQVKLGEVPGFTQAGLGSILRELMPKWLARSYHLLQHNCNHFTEALAEEISKRYKVSLVVPKWVNRAARFADVFVPDRIYRVMMRGVPQPPASSTQASPSFEKPPQPQQQPSAANTTATSEDDAQEQLKIPESHEELCRLSVRELKTLMWVHRIDWEGCVEKGDLIKLLEEYKAKMKAGA